MWNQCFVFSKKNLLKNEAVDSILANSIFCKQVNKSKFGIHENFCYVGKVLLHNKIMLRLPELDSLLSV